VNWRAISSLIGALLLATAVGMLLPLGWALGTGEGDALSIAIGALIAAGVGGPLRWTLRNPGELSARDAFVVATLGWIFVSVVSAIPFVVYGAIPSPVDAFFEMVSGYTTTGSTILNDIEALPQGLLLWRSETHLIGGMGFVTLAVTMLPHGLGGLRLFRAESSPGQVVTRERFLPRNRDAIRTLWAIYLALNAAQVVLLMAGGMPLFDSLCHTFGTISTSGFSPYNDSVGHYNSLWFDAVISLFMFLGGVTFLLFFSLWQRDWKTIHVNTELRWYLSITALLCGGVAAILWWNGTYPALESVQYAVFQVLSLLTTTGFATADYELWPQSAQMLLVFSCFIGACAGSTTSGIKIVHYVLIIKFMVQEIRRQYFQPLSLVSIRLNGRRVDLGVVHLAFAYFIVNIFMILSGGFVITLAEDVDLVTALSSIVATLMNIGPGWGDIGPTENFSQFSDFTKLFLSGNMLVGRLEMFSALVLFYPGFWRS
jgi:trk system potassium uptake protein